MAFPAKDGILNDDSLLDTIAPGIQPNDEWAFLNMVLTNCPTTKLAGGVGTAITMNTIHLAAPFPLVGPCPFNKGQTARACLADGLAQCEITAYQIIEIFSTQAE